MIDGRLIDLDELILRCRDEQAKQYIAEAVGCYKVGAYRSCIVATWIAVVFDFLYKLRELDLTGDKNARRKLEEFEKIRRSADVSGSLNFEKKILDIARDEFELLTPLEHTDLSRLLEDRNRCAHPSMNSVEDVYQPTGELARYHLRNAVTYLLERPPVQGKAAIEWLVNEIDSIYFPVSTEAAVRSFSSGPLSRATVALIRNFTIVLTKSLLSGDLDETAERRYFAAINAVLQMHRIIVDQTLAQKLNDIVKTLPDEHFGLALQFTEQVPDTWQYLGGDVRARMNTYVSNMPQDEVVPNLLTALRNGELRSAARAKLKHIMSSRLAQLFELDKDRIFLDDFVDASVLHYEQAWSFATANGIGRQLLIPLTEHFNKSHLERIVKAASDNTQVRDSYEMTNVLRALREKGQMSTEDFDELLKEHELEGLLKRTTPNESVVEEEDDIPF